MLRALLLSAAFALLPSLCRAAAMPAAEAERFIADLEVLAEALPSRHANLFHTTPRDTFEAEVATLRAALPSMSRGEALIGLARIVGLARDGHSALFLLPFPGMAPIDGIRQLPVQFFLFADGLRIVAVERSQQRALGARVSAIGGVPVAEALRRVGALVPRDNAMGEAEYGAWYLALPEVLDALGLARGGAYEFALDGVAEPLRLVPMAVPPDARWADRLITLPGPRANWVGAGDAAATPRWLSRTAEPWWFEILPDGHVYAQINLMRERPDARFGDFVERLLNAVPREGNSRLILDLRLNRGGDGDLRWPLVHGLIRHDAVNRPGRLFVLTGRRTFSAAQMLANALEQHTAAVFVGEPTGSSPNHYGELGQLALPNTGLTVFYSMLYWQHSPLDARVWIPPHVAVQPSYADLAAGRDPVLQAALAFTPPPNVAELMREHLERGDAAGAITAFRAVEARHRNPWRNLFERELNTLGYELLDAKRANDAVAVLRVAAELYPDSYNAWDSLGEAWLAAGVRHRAAFCYARAVRLKPDYQWGKDALQRILETR